MSQTALLKLLEVGLLAAGLLAFVVWQMRDLKRAREATEREKRLQADQAAASGSDRSEDQGHAP